MSNYEFAGILHRKQTAMLDEIAHRWITSSGSATQDEVRDILLDASDDDLAVECITEWELNQPDDTDDPDSVSHMARHGYEATDLERAFARFRADIEHDMDVEARGDDEMYAP